MRITTFLVTLLLTTGGAVAQDGKPCQVPPEAAFDQRLGTWDGVWAGGSGRTVASLVLNGCVVQEAFEVAGSAQGLGVSVYDASAGLWRQTWVDGQGRYMTFSGGRVGETFVMEQLRLAQGDPWQRMVWTPLGPDRLSWEFQASADGGLHWTTLYAIDYRRASP